MRAVQVGTGCKYWCPRTLNNLPPSFRAFGVLVALNLCWDNSSSNTGECQKLLFCGRPGKVPSVHDARFHCGWSLEKNGWLDAQHSNQQAGDGIALTRLWHSTLGSHLCYYSRNYDEDIVETKLNLAVDWILRGIVFVVRKCQKSASHPIWAMTVLLRQLSLK